MINPIAAAVAGAVSLAGVGWGAHVHLTGTYAEREAVQVVSSQAQFVLDRQIAATIREIAYLERLPKPTAAQLEQLRFLRAQLAEMRRVRRGK